MILNLKQILQKVLNFISLNGLMKICRINFFESEEYFKSEIETSLKYIKIFGKELPVGIVTDTIYETELTDERIADEDIDKMLMEKMYLYEKNFLSDCNIIKRDVRREKTNDSMMFKTEYTVEGNICRQNEIFIK